MNSALKVSILLLRLSMAWYFIYAGVSKLLTPGWSAAGYLENAATFPEFYAWLASPSNIWWVDLVNEWGLTFIGIALALGFATRLASFSGAVFLFLYYLPVLSFPFVGEHSFIVDSHIREILVFVFLIVSRAGFYWGIDGVLKRTTVGSRAFFRWIAG